MLVWLRKGLLMPLASYRLFARQLVRGNSCCVCLAFALHRLFHTGYLIMCYLNRLHGNREKCILHCWHQAISVLF